MLNAPRTTPPRHTAEGAAPSAAALGDARPLAKAPGVELPADVVLQVASTSVDALVRIAGALPRLRPDLLTPVNLRRVLQNEGYAPRALPEVSAPGAQLELYRQVQSHAALAAHLPPDVSAMASRSGSDPEPCYLPTLLPAQFDDRYFVADGCAVQVQSAYGNDGVGARAAIYDLARNAPAWRQLDLPRDWSLQSISPNGRWALAHRHTNHPSRPFRLIDLRRTDAFSGFADTYLGAFPSFIADGMALLFTDEHADRMRINRVDLGQASMPVARYTTSLLPNRHVSQVNYSPRGHRAYVGNNRSAYAYHLTHASRPTAFRNVDQDDEHAHHFWNNDEDHLRFFYPYSRRAVSFALHPPVAQRSPFVPEGHTHLDVQACDGERLLTVRMQGGEEIWQLYGWDGEVTSAPVALPPGRRNRYDHSELVDFRALLLQGRSTANLAPFTFFVDFARTSPSPIALGNTHAFKLSGAARNFSDWLVGQDRCAPHNSYLLVDTSIEGGRRGQIVQVPRGCKDSYHLRADGKVMLVGRPGVGLLALGVRPLSTIRHRQ